MREYNVCMWRHWAIVSIGLIFILAPFLGLTIFIFKLSMVLGGIAIAVLGFWILSSEKLKQSAIGQDVKEFQR